MKSRLLVMTLVLTLVIGGCASQQSITYASQDLVAPMPIELRQRVDAVVLRVVANSEFQLDLGDTLEGASSEERAKEGAEAAVGAGGTFIAAGCNPGWAFLWVFTCPAGLVVGAGVAAAGSAGAGIYGGTTAWSRYDINAAKAAWDRSKRQLLLATELRDRLISTLHETTSTRVIENETAATATGQTGAAGCIALMSRTQRMQAVPLSRLPPSKMNLPSCLPKRNCPTKTSGSWTRCPSLSSNWNSNSLNWKRQFQRRIFTSRIALLPVRRLSN